MIAKARADTDYARALFSSPRARLGDSYRLKDLHSTNGTQINGVCITDAELNDGDKIRFGSVVAVFVRSVHMIL